MASWEAAKGALRRRALLRVRRNHARRTASVRDRRESAAKALAGAEADKKAFQTVGASIGRSIKVLYVGGDNADSPHRFYHDFVEVTFPRDTPLWTDAAVRNMGYAASQPQLTADSGQTGIGLSKAGATPRELVKEECLPGRAARGRTHQCVPSL